jgi:hypothetical protein
VKNEFCSFVMKVSEAIMDCTSESEVCLPSNYSRFQLPNKGKQTVVAIGELQTQRYIK